MFTVELMTNAKYSSQTGSHRNYNVRVEDNVIHVEYGYSTQDELTKSKPKIYDIGRSGRTPAEEAIVKAWKIVEKKISENYDGNYEELADAYEDIIENVKERKEEAKRMKKEEKNKS